MDEEAAASGPRDDGGHSPGGNNTAGPAFSSSATPPSQSSQLPSSTLLSPLTPSNQLSAESFDAFEASVNNHNNGGPASQYQARHVRDSANDAIGIIEHSRVNGFTESLSGNITITSGSSGSSSCNESGHRNCGRNEEVSDSLSIHMDIDTNKGVRKRTSNEALDQPNISSACKSRKAESVTPASNLNPSQVSDNQPPSLNSEPVPLQYSSYDKSPYVVYIYNKNLNSNSDSAHPLLVSKLVSNIAYNDIVEMKKIGRGKIMAELKSAKSANNLVSSSLLDANNLRAFIPAYRTLRSGIVKDIPPSISIESIRNAIEAPTFKILEISRLNRRARVNGESKTVPSSTLIIKFAG